MGIALKKPDFRPKKQVMGQILHIGVPIALQDGFIQVAFLVITIIANRRGLNQAAAVGIVEKIIGFLFLVPSSMLSSVSALAAQNIGAGKHDRAQRDASLRPADRRWIRYFYRNSDSVYRITGRWTVYIRSDCDRIWKPVHTRLYF